MKSDFVNSIKVEKLIHCLLSKKSTLTLMWDGLFDEIKNKKWDQKDIHSIASFLYCTKQHKNLVEFIYYCVEKNIILPWNFIFKLFSTYKEKDKLKYINYLIDGAKESNNLEKFFLEPSLISLSHDLKELYSDFLKKEQNKKNRIKKDIFAKMEMAHNEKLFKKEKKLLEQMIKMFPNDADIKKKYKEYKEKWAKYFLYKRSQKKIHKKKTHNKIPISYKEKAYLEYLYKHVCKLKIKQEQSFIDFSMLFYFLNGFEYTLNLLNSCEASNKEINWLKIETKLKLNHFLDVLVDTTVLSKKYKNNPEIPFIVSYMQAIALWHLEKKEKAIHFMQNIVNNRPNYRLASLYLSFWKKKGGDFES